MTIYSRFIGRKDEFATRLQAGEGANAIARSLGISSASMSKFCREAGLSHLLKPPVRHEVSTNDLGDEICRRYLAGEEIAAIASSLGRAKSKVFQVLKDRGVYDKTYVREDFFSDISDETSAYTLGFFAADGWHSPDRHAIGIEITDEQILKEMADAMGFRRPIRSRQRRHWKRQYVMNIVSKRMSEDLLRLGIGARKTFTLTFPRLPDTLVRHFVRGYFDGDGCFGSYERGGAMVAIISTEEFLLCLRDIIEQEVGVPSRIQPLKRTDTHNVKQLKITKRADCCAFCDWMYAGATIYLHRKYDKYRTFLQEYALYASCG